MTKTTIAIIGVSGSLGQPILDVLQSDLFKDKVQFPIKAFSRRDIPSTETVEYIKADITEENIPKIIEELNKDGGVDTIIELVASDPKLFALVTKIIVGAKPKLFIPSQFGVEIDKVNTYIPNFLSHKTIQSKTTREAGIKTVDIITGFFFAPGTYLYEAVQQIGIDPNTKTLEIFGDLSNKISVNFVDDIAKSVVSIATNSKPNELPNKVRIAGDVVTFQQIVDTFEKNHNTKLQITKQVTSQEALNEFFEKIKNGPKHEDIFFYLHTIASQGTDKGIHYSINENEIVNPGEKLWKWAKY
ncbi:CIP1 protein [Scheffersomyces amazonensis]|uniref:CIP1 protein n=1 Tax=Scheffersomyces amazonensis TaxID=1078765 RepID=UPI00315DFE31